MQIRQMHPLFVGEVSGVDLRRAPAPETVAAIDGRWINTPCWCFAANR
jgi:hypothetical protein